jgi:hypothetical protein
MLALIAAYRRRAAGLALNLGRLPDAIFYQDGADLRLRSGLTIPMRNMLTVTVTPTHLIIRVSPPANLFLEFSRVVPRSSLVVHEPGQELLRRWVPMTIIRADGRREELLLSVRHTDEFLAALSA